ncbi:hypothetical protein DPV78_010278 [Talaromyces pinophilus]|nr:hypothetical protein DPV78_010278 [Talaromyces pinophilus]
MRPISSSAWTTRLIAETSGYLEITPAGSVSNIPTSSTSKPLLECLRYKYASKKPVIGTKQVTPSHAKSLADDTEACSLSSAGYTVNVLVSFCSNVLCSMSQLAKYACRISVEV